MTDMTVEDLLGITKLPQVGAVIIRRLRTVRLRTASFNSAWGGCGSACYAWHGRWIGDKAVAMLGASEDHELPMAFSLVFFLGKL